MDLQDMKYGSVLKYIYRLIQDQWEEEKLTSRLMIVFLSKLLKACFASQGKFVIPHGEPWVPMVWGGEESFLPCQGVFRQYRWEVRW